jgi:hypothetical protein
MFNRIMIANVFGPMPAIEARRSPRPERLHRALTSGLHTIAGSERWPEAYEASRAASDRMMRYRSTILPIVLGLDYHFFVDNIDARFGWRIIRPSERQESFIPEQA